MPAASPASAELLRDAKRRLMAPHGRLRWISRRFHAVGSDAQANPTPDRVRVYNEANAAKAALKSAWFALHCGRLDPAGPEFAQIMAAGEAAAASCRAQCRALGVEPRDVYGCPPEFGPPEG